MRETSNLCFETTKYLQNLFLGHVGGLLFVHHVQESLLLLRELFSEGSGKAFDNAMC
jgi:hypothetical protein